MLRKMSLRLCLIALLLVGVSSWADDIPVSVPIQNGSFEATTLAPGGWTMGAPGWTLNGVGGAYAPTGSIIEPPAADGNNAFWLNSGSVSQTLAETYGPYMNYTLSVAVGQRADFSGVSYMIQFLAGDVVLASYANPVSPDPGTWGNAVVTFSTGVSASFFGQPLTISFTNTGNSQVLFDNVSMTAVDPQPVADVAVSNVPEPASLLLLSSGLATIGGVIRRRRK